MMRKIPPALLAAFAVLIVAGIWLVVRAVSPPPKPDVVTTAAVKAAVRPLDNIPECPHDWKVVGDTLTAHGIVVAGTFQATGEVTVAGHKTNVPEFHDCQRFIFRAGGPGKYEVLAGVFAFQGLDTLRWNGGAVPAGYPAAFPIAEVFADGDYKPLGIVGGFNCLMIAKVGDQVVPMMVALQWAEDDCKSTATVPTGTNVTLLKIRSLPYASEGLGSLDIPPVARWDTDNESYFIGLKCADQWCEVGPKPTYGLSPQYGAATGGSATVRRVKRVKGWYDEQYLADYVGGHAVPSLTRGVVFANPALDAYNRTDAFATNTWLEVAGVSISSQLYATKYNLNTSWPPVGIGPTPNRIFLCRNSAAEPNRCNSPAPSATVTFATSWGSCSPTREGGDWRAKIVSVNSGGTTTERYFCVKGRTHDGITIPGVVRWRWRPNDETIWISCVLGCCEVDAFQ